MSQPKQSFSSSNSSAQEKQWSMSRSSQCEKSGWQPEIVSTVQLPSSAVTYWSFFPLFFFCLGFGFCTALLASSRWSASVLVRASPVWCTLMRLLVPGFCSLLGFKCLTKKCLNSVQKGVSGWIEIYSCHGGWFIKWQWWSHLVGLYCLSVEWKHSACPKGRLQMMCLHCIHPQLWKQWREICFGNVCCPCFHFVSVDNWTPCLFKRAEDTNIKRLQHMSGV